MRGVGPGAHALFPNPKFFHFFRPPPPLPLPNSPCSPPQSCPVIQSVIQSVTQTVTQSITAPGPAARRPQPPWAFSLPAPAKVAHEALSIYAQKRCWVFLCFLPSREQGNWYLCARGTQGCGIEHMSIGVFEYFSTLNLSISVFQYFEFEYFSTLNSSI